MNIIVDGRPFVATSAGISTFLKCSLFNWAEQSSQDNFILFIPRDYDKSLELNLPNNVSVYMIKNRMLRLLPNLILSLIFIPFLTYKYKADLLYCPIPCLPIGLYSKTKTIVVVHDFVNKLYKETITWRTKISTFLLGNRSIKNADLLWANSFYTKELLIKYYPQRKCQDIFVGCSIDTSIYKPLYINNERKSSIKKKLGINGQFLLFVGSLEPRKNLSFLLNLMPDLYTSKGIQLVVVGGKGWKNSSIKQIVLQSNYPKEAVIFCGYLNNAELAELYNIADCFISSSLNEGFGMPQLEALKCGCPVITSHNSAMIEVVNGVAGGYTIKDYEPCKWLDTIIKVLNKPRIVSTECLTKYDWKEIITQLIFRIKS
ncbi:glycosyltransferase family 4 protein [Phocaeicola plebeius]|uniref:glycosyltransferase family 4 protein n=1 Tax=Phocaeicola plebeius TaxID=310297 RepID=UPI00195E545E|nr:glycosyltransferase family 1 protein [Phocaeicola plebeius]MBM6963902.1 glycosyltransferase family 4 protein [Phocaeicola plebeius]